MILSKNARNMIIQCFDDDMTLEETADLMNALDFAPPRGKKWTKTSISNHRRKLKLRKYKKCSTKAAD